MMRSRRGITCPFLLWSNRQRHLGVGARGTENPSPIRPAEPSESALFGDIRTWYRKRSVLEPVALEPLPARLPASRAMSALRLRERVAAD
jgi:hypothetical protein